MALKRKKRLEKQLQQIDGTLSTIEFQREALENANTNTEVLKNMSYAAKALKSAHQQLWVYLKKICEHTFKLYQLSRLAIKFLTVQSVRSCKILGRRVANFALDVVTAYM